MIIEHALLRVAKSEGDAFAAAVRTAFPIIESAPGCHGAEVRVQHEDPSVYLLIVQWDSVQAHQAFRASELYERWRAATHPYYAVPPEVTHFLAPLPR
ncbi:MAG: antibiotic biosynthesis monooxygenase family protein [Acidimicrobiales bacterium]